MRPVHFSHRVDNCREQMRIAFDYRSDVTKSDLRKREIRNDMHQSFYAACKSFVVSQFHCGSLAACACLPRTLQRTSRCDPEDHAQCTVKSASKKFVILFSTLAPLRIRRTSKGDALHRLTGAIARRSRKFQGE